MKGETMKQEEMLVRLEALKADMAITAIRIVCLQERTLLTQFLLTYQNCFSVMDENTFDVVTWNIENFPVAGTTTINHVENIIKNLYADVIAVQEIGSVSSFNTLLTKIRPFGYDGVLATFTEA